MNLRELLLRCQQITNKSIGDLSNELNVCMPEDLLRAKGWIGQLIESYLGAESGSKALPDFPNLGIELKTIPINGQSQPLESTYVCTVQSNDTMLTWHNSWVYQKLKHVLWVPCLASRNIPIHKRIIKAPFLWKMDSKTENILRTDWEELMDMIQLGYAKELTAKFGTYLHIRPKAASSKILIDYLAFDGTVTKIVPKGFYLRTNFTKELLQNHNLDIFNPCMELL